MKCWWKFGHVWGIWHDFGLVYQERQCERCGFYQLKSK